MNIQHLTLGALGENCYLCVEELSGDAFVVDPGTPSPSIVSLLQEMGMKQVKYIFLTHGHFDHILGVAYLKEQFPQAEVVISEPDAVFLMDPRYSGANPTEQTPVAADRVVKDLDTISFGGKQIQVLHTPGHTAGSVCYQLERTLFSGDTLFMKTYGRTDFYSGSMEQMKQSLVRLGSLEGDYRVLPGHGPETSLDFERTHNRYMRKVAW